MGEQVRDFYCHLSDSITIIHADCRDEMEAFSMAPAIILDPPFDQWWEVPHFRNSTAICFTNWQNRAEVEARFGCPRFELIWHFKVGRWVSHSLPRITHENILVYGKTGSCYVGEPNTICKPVNKGRGSVGRDQLAERFYTPRPRKALNSVLEFPRNVRGELGCWGKPVELMERLIEWVSADFVADPYMGGGSVGIACIRKGVRYLGIERDKQKFEIAKQRLERELVASLEERRTSGDENR